MTHHTIATDRSGWVKAFGKKWYGRWMRPFKFWYEGVPNHQTVLIDRNGNRIEMGVDEIQEVWEFHSHAAEATPMHEDMYLFDKEARVWNQDPYLKYGEYDQ